MYYMHISFLFFDREVLFIVRSFVGKPPHLREAFRTGHMTCGGWIFMTGRLVRFTNHIDAPPPRPAPPACNDDDDDDDDAPNRESSPSCRTVFWRVSPCWA